MDNTKRNVHNSGPLGMLVKNGQVKKVDSTQLASDEIKLPKTGGSYFKTKSGIEFSEHELMYVDPKECEPWKYANRHEDELGDIGQLVQSIKSNKQLQPALVRNHPNPTQHIKYEIIFGRRRHIACLQLGIPFLVIRKEISNIQDAIAAQDAENKLRNDVSNYSNAKLYQRLLNDGVFKTEKELSLKLALPTSSFNDLMAYAKIPDVIVKKIPNVHELSKSLALKIAHLSNLSPLNVEKITAISHEIGKSITSPAKLETAISTKPTTLNIQAALTKLYKSSKGEKLFTFMIDFRGSPCVVINKEIANKINTNDICKLLCDHLEGVLSKSGGPD